MLSRRFTDWFVFLFLFLVCCIPFGIETSIAQVKLNLPTEPLIAIFALLLCFRLDWKAFIQSGFLKHPISILSMVYLTWMALMIPFSSNITISFKYFIVSAAHWWVFYIGFWYLNRSGKINLKRLICLYSLALIPILFYTWWIHGAYDFRVDIAGMAARPFYKDNTLYGLCFSMLLLSLAYAFVTPPKRGKWEDHRWLLGILSILLGIGLYLSFCRAAWLSVFLTMGLIAVILVFKLNFTKVIGSIVLGAIGLLLLIPMLNSDVVSKQGNALQQLKSIPNITTDASNLERINRYKCAWRMFLERPITGFGAGTYPVAYLPFQKKNEMTRLSVTSVRQSDGRAHFSGRGCSAHSIEKLYTFRGTCSEFKKRFPKYSSPDYR